MVPSPALAKRVCLSDDQYAVLPTKIRLRYDSLSPNPFHFQSAILLLTSDTSLLSGAVAPSLQRPPVAILDIAAANPISTSVSSPTAVAYVHILYFALISSSPCRKNAKLQNTQAASKHRYVFSRSRCCCSPLISVADTPNRREEGGLRHHPAPILAASFLRAASPMQAPYGCRLCEASRLCCIADKQTRANHFSKSCVCSRLSRWRVCRAPPRCLHAGLVKTYYGLV